MEDVFALQDEITMCVIGAIEPSLRKAEIERIKRQRPTNLNAYDLVLRSLPFVLAHIPEDSAPAIPLLEEALKLQPDYAAAHAFLARCFHHRFARAGFREEDRITAIRHAHAAIAHGSDDATALAVAAAVIAYDEHDTATALKLFDRALELSNSNAFALGFNAVILAYMGRVDLAFERAQQALRLSPFDSDNFRPNHALAIAHFLTGAIGGGGCGSNAIRQPAVQCWVCRFGGRALANRTLTEAKAPRGRCWNTTDLHHWRNFACAELEPAVFKPFAEAWREVGLPE